MNSQERDIIAGIFQRLEQAASQPRDPEAERFIADKLRQQPSATYAMAQSIYVQEEAIKALNQQLEQAREELEHARQAPQSGGFLSSIFGGGAAAGQRPDDRAGAAFNRPGNGAPPSGYAPQGGYQPQQQGGPWAQQGGPQQGGPWGGQQGGMQQQPPARSGFLGGALTTAAGVAGGMVVGSALMNAFSGGHSALGAAATGAGASGAGGETVVNNYYDNDASADGNADSGVQNASYDDAGGGGGDFDLGGGGSDDWT